MAKKTKISADINKKAKSIVDLATSEVKSEDTGKNPAAVALGRLGD